MLCVDYPGCISWDVLQLVTEGEEKGPSKASAKSGSKDQGGPGEKGGTGQTPSPESAW